MHVKRCWGGKVQAPPHNEVSNTAEGITSQISTEAISVTKEEWRVIQPRIQEEASVEPIPQVVSQEVDGEVANPEDATPSPQSTLRWPSNTDGTPSEVFHPHPFDPQRITIGFHLPQKP